RHTPTPLRSTPLPYTTLFRSTLYLYGEQFGDELPRGPIALPHLRDLLLRPSTSLATRNAVWREVIGRAQTDRGTWVVVAMGMAIDRKSTRLNSSHLGISYAVF